MFQKFLRILLKLVGWTSQPATKLQKENTNNTKVGNVNTSRKKTRGATLRAKNESPRLKDELKTLKERNNPLFELIVDLADWIDSEFNKNTVITMIYRTDSEQNAIYKGTFRGSRSYDENPWKSPHQVWTAIDIRSRIYTEEEIQKIKNYLNTKHNSTNYYKTTAMYHEVTNSSGQSLGKHFHLQYAEK